MDVILTNYPNSDKIRWNPETYILIPTGDLNDRGHRIKDTLLFAMNTPFVYTLMSNHDLNYFAS
jgi:hypothetical protein